MGVGTRSRPEARATVLSSMLIALLVPFVIFALVGTRQLSATDLFLPSPQIAKRYDEIRLSTRFDNDASDENVTLSRRALTYAAAANKGIMLQCLLEATNLDDVQAYLTAQGKGAKATSIWTNIGALYSNGWRLNTNADEPGFDVDDFTDAFGVTASNNVYQQWVQDQQVRYLGVTYLSGGKYGNLFNVQGGLIAADENYSPTTISKRPRNVLVPLQQWSDVVFLGWQQLCLDYGADIAGLTKVFRIAVSGPDSKTIITQAVASVGGSMDDEWNQKVRLDAGQPGFYAILGTVNGEGLAWLLLQHRRQMGQLVINAVSYFLEPNTEDYCLYFEIGPYTSNSDPP